MRCFTASLIALLFMAAAGCSGFVVISNGTLLVAVTVNPTVGDPLGFPNNTVPFVATGSFGGGANNRVTLNNVLWTVESPFFNGGVPNSGHATIDQNGNATCAAGFTGSVPVFATVPLNASQPVSISNQKVGSAQLICP